MNPLIYCPHLAEMEMDGLKDRRARILGELINDRLHRRGLKAKDVAHRANLHESTFSAIRKGTRGVSRQMVESIARALNTNREEAEQDVNEFLMAAGFVPQSLSKRRPVVIELLNKEGLLEIEASMKQGEPKHVWVFSPGLIETFQKDFFKVVCDNLQQGVSYTYFFHYANALHWGIFLQELLRGGLNPGEHLKGFVLTDESFRSRDANLFECIYDAQSDGSFKVFRTSREVKGEFLYREENREDATEFRDYLMGIKRAANRKGQDQPPCPIETYLRETYGPDVADKLIKRSSKKTK